MSRRRFLCGAASLAGAWLAGTLEGGTAWAQPRGRAHATSCILLWMNGGPSHVDTFDPKRDAEASARAMRTSAPGIEIAEHLPRLAGVAHQLAFVRGLSTTEGNHQRAQELGHTGHTPNPTVAAPSLGAWIARARAAEGAALPPHVALGGPGGSAGLLGRTFDPFVVQRAGSLPTDLRPARPVGETRTRRREALLDALDADLARTTAAPVVAERRAIASRARRLSTSAEIDAFDVAGEPSRVRADYGDTDFGRGCLVARRLVEQGVPFVEVALDGWDTHEDNATRVAERCAILDPAMTALLGDLEARGLLARTVVLCMGEFGRTPRLGRRGGRDHHPAAFSAVLAGGGLRGGVVHGATDATGERVVEGRVGVGDVLATVAKACGLDPGATAFSPRGRPVSVVERGAPIDALFG